MMHRELKLTFCIYYMHTSTKAFNVGKSRVERRYQHNEYEVMLKRITQFDPSQIQLQRGVLPCISATNYQLPKYSQCVDYMLSPS